MPISGIQGLPLEVTVVGCNNLKDKEWISRQDPYVCLEYGSAKFRTKTCTDGGKNPTFQEKYIFTLIEGLRELNVMVWNSNTLSTDDFIGSGRIQLHKVLSQGYDDTAWPLQSKSGSYSGEVRLILYYSNAIQSATRMAPPGQPYATSAAALSQVLQYNTPPQAPPATYTAATTAYLPVPSYVAYSPSPAIYLPPPCPSAQLAAAYFPQPWPPAGYPSQPSTVAGFPYPPQPYPPPPQSSTYYPPVSHAGIYPPPPY